MTKEWAQEEAKNILAILTMLAHDGLEADEEILFKIFLEAYELSIMRVEARNLSQNRFNQLRAYKDMVKGLKLTESEIEAYTDILENLIA